MFNVCRDVTEICYGYVYDCIEPEGGVYVYIYVIYVDFVIVVIVIRNEIKYRFVINRPFMVEKRAWIWFKGHELWGMLKCHLIPFGKVMHISDWSRVQTGSNDLLNNSLGTERSKKLPDIEVVAKSSAAKRHLSNKLYPLGTYFTSEYFCFLKYFCNTFCYSFNGFVFFTFKNQICRYVQNS